MYAIEALAVETGIATLPSLRPQHLHFRFSMGAPGCEKKPTSHPGEDYAGRRCGRTGMFGFRFYLRVYPPPLGVVCVSDW